MSPRSPSMTTRRACLSHEIHSQVDLHRVYGGVVPELASRDHVRRLLPLVKTRWPTRRPRPARSTASPIPQARADRRVADGRGARPVAGLRLERAGDRGSPPGGSSARAAAGDRSAAVSAPGAAGVRRAHHAHRRGGPGLVRGARRNARRRGWRGLRQIRQVVRPAVSGRTGAREARGARGAPTASIFRVPCSIAPARVQFLRPEDRRVARGEGTAQAGRLDDATRADIAAACSRPSSIRSAKTCARWSKPDTRRWWWRAASARTAAAARRLAEAARRAGARVYYPRIEFCTDNAAMIAVAGMARLKAGKHETAAIRARATWSLDGIGVSVSELST